MPYAVWLPSDGGPSQLIPPASLPQHIIDYTRLAPTLLFCEHAPRELYNITPAGAGRVGVSESSPVPEHTSNSAQKHTENSVSAPAKTCSINCWYAFNSAPAPAWKPSSMQIFWLEGQERRLASGLEELGVQMGRSVMEAGVPRKGQLTVREVWGLQPLYNHEVKAQKIDKGKGKEKEHTIDGAGPEASNTHKLTTTPGKTIQSPKTADELPTPQTKNDTPRGSTESKTSDAVKPLASKATPTPTSRRLTTAPKPADSKKNDHGPSLADDEEATLQYAMRLSFKESFSTVKASPSQQHKASSSKQAAIDVEARAAQEAIKHQQQRVLIDMKARTKEKHIKDAIVLSSDDDLVILKPDDVKKQWKPRLRVLDQFGFAKNAEWEPITSVGAPIEQYKFDIGAFLQEYQYDTDTKSESDAIPSIELQDWNNSQAVPPYTQESLSGSDILQRRARSSAPSPDDPQILHRESGSDNQDDHNSEDDGDSSSSSSDEDGNDDNGVPVSLARPGKRSSSSSNSRQEAKIRSNQESHFTASPAINSYSSTSNSHNKPSGSNFGGYQSKSSLKMPTHTTPASAGNNGGMHNEFTMDPENQQQGPRRKRMRLWSNQSDVDDSNDADDEADDDENDYDPMDLDTSVNLNPNNLLAGGAGRLDGSTDSEAHTDNNDMDLDFGKNATNNDRNSNGSISDAHNISDNIWYKPHLGDDNMGYETEDEFNEYIARIRVPELQRLQMGQECNEHVCEDDYDPRNPETGLVWNIHDDKKKEWITWREDFILMLKEEEMEKCESGRRYDRNKFHEDWDPRDDVDLTEDEEDRRWHRDSGSSDKDDQRSDDQDNDDEEASMKSGSQDLSLEERLAIDPSRVPSSNESRHVSPFYQMRHSAARVFQHSNIFPPDVEKRGRHPLRWFERVRKLRDQYRAPQRFQHHSRRDDDDSDDDDDGGPSPARKRIKRAYGEDEDFIPGFKKEPQDNGLSSPAVKDETKDSDTKLPHRDSLENSDTGPLTKKERERRGKGPWTLDDEISDLDLAHDVLPAGATFGTKLKAILKQESVVKDEAALKLESVSHQESPVKSDLSHKDDSIKNEEPAGNIEIAVVIPFHSATEYKKLYAHRAGESISDGTILPYVDGKGIAHKLNNLTPKEAAENKSALYDLPPKHGLLSQSRNASAYTSTHNSSAHSSFGGIETVLKPGQGWPIRYLRSNSRAAKAAKEEDDEKVKEVDAYGQPILASELYARRCVKNIDAEAAQKELMRRAALPPSKRSPPPKRHLSDGSDESYAEQSSKRQRTSKSAMDDEYQEAKRLHTSLSIPAFDAYNGTGADDEDEGLYPVSKPKKRAPYVQVLNHEQKRQCAIAAKKRLAKKLEDERTAEVAAKIASETAQHEDVHINDAVQVNPEKVQKANQWFEEQMIGLEDTDQSVKQSEAGVEAALPFDEQMDVDEHSAINDSEMLHLPLPPNVPQPMPPNAFFNMDFQLFDEPMPDSPAGPSDSDSNDGGAVPVMTGSGPRPGGDDGGDQDAGGTMDMAMAMDMEY